MDYQNVLSVEAYSMSNGMTALYTDSNTFLVNPKNGGYFLVPHNIYFPKVQLCHQFTADLEFDLYVQSGNASSKLPLSWDRATKRARKKQDRSRKEL